jgi:hypothetical protein
MANRESKGGRLDRELGELLQELRVALPGVQVLFAFLLTVPFSQRFTRVTDLQRGTYFATFLAAATASVFLIAPTAYHRLRWREYDKERMLVSSTRLAIAGTVALALAITGAVMFTTDVLFGVPVAAGVAAAVAGLLAWFWFALPLLRRVRDRS